MNIFNMGWANKRINHYGILFEQDEAIGEVRPPQPSIELSQSAIIGPMFDFIQKKMIAYKKKSLEEGKEAKLTPYRDRSIYFLQFIKDNFPEMVNDKLAEIERKKTRAKREGATEATPIDAEGITEKKRIPSATEINWWFGNTLRSMPNGQEMYNKIKQALIEKTDDNAIKQYINIVSTTRGERFKIDADAFLPDQDISTALSTPLSAFKSPGERFEEQIPEESRVSLEETKDFLIKALEAFKSDNTEDPFISDSVDTIINGVEANTSVEDLEDYILTQARKYNRIAQTEDEGGAKELYNILGDIVENFRHFKLFSAIKGVPAAAEIKPGSLEDIKDDAIYDIEDYLDKNQSPLNDRFKEVIKKIQDMKTVKAVTDYLDERIKVLPTHSNADVRAFGKNLEKIYSKINDKINALETNAEEIGNLEKEMETADTTQKEIEAEKRRAYGESHKLTGKQVNTLLLENYRNSIRNKVRAQIVNIY